MTAQAVRETEIIADLKRSLKSTKINRDIHKGASKKYGALLWDAQQTIRLLEKAQETRDQRIDSLSAQLRYSKEEIETLESSLQYEMIERLR